MRFVACAVIMQVRNDQSFSHILLWEPEIYCALLKQVTWMDCQYSTLIGVAVCDVSGHFVDGQVRSNWNLFCARIVWSSIDLEVYFRCRNRFVDIAVRYKRTHNTYMMYGFEMFYCLGFSNRSCVGLRVADNSRCWV